MKTIMYPSVLKKIIKAIGISAVYLLIWQVAAVVVAQPLILPSPIETGYRLAVILRNPMNLFVIAITIFRVFVGFSIGVVLGILFGVITAHSPLLEQFLLPLRGLIRAVPVTSVILLFLLWVSSGMVAVWISLLMVIPIVWTQTATAIKQTDKALLEMASVFHFKKRKLIRHIYIPSVSPHFLGAATTSLGFAWKAGVAAEILSLPKSAIGQKLYLAKISLETADLFAWTVCVVLISLLMEKGFIFLTKRWQYDRVD